MEQHLKLSAPWVTFWHEIQALFSGDPEIQLVFDENENHIKLFVENDRKADALMKLLPTEKTYGNVTLKISVIPANVKNDEDKLELFKVAFEKNPVLAYATTSSNPVTGELQFVVFENRVVQFFNDDLTDIHGYKSTLYQDIAKDVFGETAGLYFCTDIPVFFEGGEEG